MSSNVPHTAMVLAAGLGTRMRPLTDTCPKPLIEVGGKRLMDRMIEPLIEAGVQRIVVNVHWLADQVEAHVAGLKGVDLIVSDERGEVLETGGALAKAAPVLGDDPVFVVNTDAFWGKGDATPLLELAEAFDPERMDELLLLADTQRSLGYGGAGDFLRAETGSLTRRGENPSAPWAYAGVRILKPQAFAGIEVERFSVAWRIWGPLVESGRLHGLPLDDFWLHVGDPEALKDAEMWLRCHGE
ncbi:nucleotidyltransferase family protein [uncultured Hyphomonas sp.]|uniref:nucleotidyltransferase family protein n=1 Tax=uncultured Hyphomonas sp. TaxID=225298 RepID=UPI0030DA350E|tara:strand:- start:12262 stop:12990 length:729 start_codon:yes stop_codon:yes gene_type:complete